MPTSPPTQPFHFHSDLASAFHVLGLWQDSVSITGTHYQRWGLVLSSSSPSLVFSVVADFHRLASRGSSALHCGANYKLIRVLPVGGSPRKPAFGATITRKRTLCRVSQATPAENLAAMSIGCSLVGSFSGNVQLFLAFDPRQVSQCANAFPLSPRK